MANSAKTNFCSLLAKSVLKEKNHSLQRCSYCEFSADDWQSLKIDISSIIRLLANKEKNLETPLDTAYGVTWRSVAICQFQHGEVYFLSKANCSTRSRFIVKDYDEKLGKCVSLRSLIGALLKVVPKGIATQGGLRILVELAARSDVMSGALPPHADGVTFLFFLALQSSVTGGEMKLFQAESIPNQKKQYTSINGTDFYIADNLSVINEIPFLPGNGYLIDERRELNSPRILHGANGWAASKFKLGVRGYLRISFQLRD